MPRRDDELFNTSPIVPDTDDRAYKVPPRLSAHGNAARARATKQPGTGKQFFTGILLATLFAICGYFHYQMTLQQMANAKLQNRIEALESQLGVASTAVNQTSETLGEKLKQLEGRLTATNSEIAKLWAVANDKTKKSLEEQGKSLALLQTGVSELKKTLSQVEKSAAEASRLSNENRLAVANVTTSLSDSKSTMGALQQRLAQEDPKVIEASKQAREASQQAAILQEQADQLAARLEKLAAKVSAHEESLRSIDSFRSIVSSDLGKLKQQYIEANRPVTH